MEHEVDVVIRVKIVLDVVTGPFASAVEEARELGAAEQAGVLTSVNPSEKSVSAAEADPRFPAALKAAHERQMETLPTGEINRQATAEPEIQKAHPPGTHGPYHATTGIPNLRKLKSSLLAPKAGEVITERDAFAERLAEDEIPSAEKIGDEMRKRHAALGGSFQALRAMKTILVELGAPGGDPVQLPKDKRQEFLARIAEIK